MGTTAGGLPYPEPTDPVAGTAGFIKALAEAVDRAVFWEAAVTPAAAAGWAWGGGAGSGLTRTKDGKWVRWRGQMDRTGASVAADTATTLIVLPAGYRPGIWTRMPAAIAGGATAVRIQIALDGTVTMHCAAAVGTGSYISLDNIEYATGTTTP